MPTTREFTFVTSNEHKLHEAQSTCEPYGITIVQGIADVLEIQGTNPQAIAMSKAEQAFSALGKTVLVNDSSWAIDALKGFPGAYMHDINQWFSPDDFLALMCDRKNRRVALIDTIVQLGHAGCHIFTQQTEGYITDEVRGISGPSSDRIIVLGDRHDRTIAERRESGEVASRGVVELWTKFCKFVVRNA